MRVYEASQEAAAGKFRKDPLLQPFKMKGGVESYAGGHLTSIGVYADMPAEGVYLRQVDRDNIFFSGRRRGPAFANLRCAPNELSDLAIHFGGRFERATQKLGEGCRSSSRMLKSGTASGLHYHVH